jgi:myosin heavy subunit
MSFHDDDMGEMANIDEEETLAKQLVKTATTEKGTRRKSSILQLAKSRSFRQPSFLSATDLAAVYIQDDAYSWLPATIMRNIPPTGNSVHKKVEVSLTLPPHWHERTVLSPDSTILDLEELTAESMTRIVTLNDNYQASNYELPLQNLQQGGKRDMADLPNLHEAAILFNLKERHATQHPYTRVGDIVVAMNPFSWISSLYTQETRDLYAKNLLRSLLEEDSDSDGERKANETNDDDDEDDDDAFLQYTKLGHDPHVYETSCLAYRGLLREGVNQTILVTGESGAGKTETVKIVMKHLATLHVNDDAVVDSTVVARVLESNPVFEAFGNAKTLRNDNSSRFGKFTQLQFALQENENGKPITQAPLAGSVCDTYLLEKSRVVSHSPGERNYHVFYQLLQGAPNVMKAQIWKHLEDTDLESFLYLGHNAEYQLLPGGHVDAEEWPQTLEALEVFSFVGDKLMTLLRALCGVLQLGNICFAEDPSSDEAQEGGTVVASREELDKLQDILGIPAEMLETCMTTRNLKTGYDVVQVRLSPTVAKDATDALAKEIYARIFDVLVQSINEYTKAAVSDVVVEETEGEDEDTESSTPKSPHGIICLLDIFGFERFAVNRFEQLCINYANEHLQHKYVLDNFKQFQEEYESEGIELFDFRVVDNSDVLHLLENRLGILISLNEECVRPKGNDESFVYKVKIVNKDHDRIIDRKLHLKTEFGIRHFAGPVTYNATKFVERNTDKLPDNLIECVSLSKNELIATEFQKILAEARAPPPVEANARPGRRRKASSKTVLQKFRLQLKALMNSIQHTTTRYIRCIKPNDNMIPKMTDHYTTMRQLECAGLVTAITISRETFPNKLGYETTHERFDCLMAKQDKSYMISVSDKEAVQYMLSNLLLPMVEEQANGKIKIPFACGNTRVYFRAGALEHLETKRLDYYTQRVIFIQNWIRRIQAQERFQRMRDASISIQRIARGRLEMQRYREEQQACILLATWVRGRQATALVQSLREDRAATVVQNTWRTKSQAYQMSRMKKAAIIIQRAIRSRESRENFTAKLAVAVEEARMDNKLLGLKDSVSKSVAARPPKKGMSDRTVNEELLQEVESMFDYLREEIFTLRGANSKLKAEVNDGEEEKRELRIHKDTAEASATASRIQVAKLMKVKTDLSKEVLGQRHETAALRKELKAVGTERSEQVASVKIDYEKLLEEKDEEIDMLKTTVRKTMKRNALDMKQIQDQAAKADEGHVTEIMRLKDELCRTQESHHDYLAKLMDVLETTHQAREQETARISAELLAVKEEKDSQIHALQREVDTLHRVKRAAPSAQIMASSSAAAVPPKRSYSKVNEVTVVRRELERTSAARQQRAQKFQEVSSRLLESVSPDNLVAITSARRARGKKMSVVEEETIRMKKMVRFLGDLYSLEETSQAKVDRDMLSSMNSYMAALEPNAAIMRMELSISQLEGEKKRLKEEVGNHGSCQRCEARDRRRINRNRSNRSPTRHDSRSQDGDG